MPFLQLPPATGYLTVAAGLSSQWSACYGIKSTEAHEAVICVFACSALCLLTFIVLIRFASQLEQQKRIVLHLINPVTQVIAHKRAHLEAVE